MIPFAEAVRRLEEARTLTRTCLRDAEAFAKRVPAVVPTAFRGSDPRTSRRLDRVVRKLGDLVSAARTRSNIAIADEKRLAALHAQARAGDASPALASPEVIAEHWNVQKAFAKEVGQAVSRLEASLAAAKSSRDRLQAQRSITSAQETLDRANVVVARAAGQVNNWKPPTRGGRK